jgi:hypothetical protein
MEIYNGRHQVSHDEKGNIKPSRLKGDPARDINIVLNDVTGFLSAK